MLYVLVQVYLPNMYVNVSVYLVVYAICLSDWLLYICIVDAT